MSSKDLILDKRFRLYSFKLFGDATPMMEYFTKRPLESFRTKVSHSIHESKLLPYDEAVGVAEIRRNLVLKVKKGQCQFNEVQYYLCSLLFRYPHGLASQSCIFLQRADNKRGIVLMQVIPKLQPTLIEFLTHDIGAFVKPVIVDPALLKRCLNSTYRKMRDAKKLSHMGDIELSFGISGLENASLQNIIVSVPRSELRLFETADENNFLDMVYEHLESSTAIRFGKLQLTKVRCNMFNFFATGKILFTQEMSSSPDSDDRPSVWYILEDLLNTVIVPHSMLA